MDCLARLLQFTRYFGWSFTTGEETANRFLFLREINSGVLKRCSCQVFEFAILTAFIFVKVIGREEPPIYNAHTRYASGFHKVHKMPVTQVKLFSRFMGGQHTIQVL